MELIARKTTTRTHEGEKIIRCPYRCLSALICHVLSATIHPDLKRTLVTISERTGMSVSQVTDEVLYKGLVGMQEMDELE